MISLLRLLRDHADAVEADLARFYGLDLLDLWRRPRLLTYRQVMVRVRHLPHDSAVASVLRDGKPAWLTEHELLDGIRQRIDAHRGVDLKLIGPHHLSPAAAAPQVDDRKAGALAATKARAEADERRHGGGG